MKRLKPLSALILIASALLLSAASENAETPKAQPKQDAYAQSPAQQHSSPSSASVSAPFQVPGTPSASHHDANTYNYYYPAEDGWDWSGIIQAVATLGLLGFALWQMDFVRRSTAATENAAKAASENAKAARDAAIATERYVELTHEMAEATKQSAKAAQLALLAERPYVFVEKQEIAMYLSLTSFSSIGKVGAGLNEVSVNPLAFKGMDRADSANANVTFHLRNRGKGVAVIKSVRLRMLLGEGLDQNKGMKLRTIGRSDGIVRFGISVLGPNEQADCFSSGLSLPLDLLDQINKWDFSLRFAVLVSYTDVFQRPFSVTFGFEYRAPIGKLEASPMLLPAFTKRRRRYS